MDEQVVITGIGLFDPVIDIFESLDFLAKSSTKSDSTLILNKFEQVDYSKFVSKRVRKKLDQFCLNGIVAAKHALYSSQLSIDLLNKDRVGIYVGNCFGGWESIEEQIIALHKEGVSGVSPYVATSWFPAALQGQLSLIYGFKGQSKTFSTMEVAGIQAVGYALDAIREGCIDVALCGASEHLSSNIIKRLLSEHYLINNSINTTMFSESSVFIVLENKKHAIERGAPIICHVDFFSDYFIYDETLLLDFIMKNLSNFPKNKPIYHLVDGIYTSKISATTTLNNSATSKNTIHLVNMTELLGQRFSVSGILELAIGALFLSEQQHCSFIDKSVNASNMLIQKNSANGHLSSIGLSR